MYFPPQEAGTSQLCTSDSDEPHIFIYTVPPKMDSETTPTNSLYIMWMVVDCFRKIVCNRRRIQKPGIILSTVAHCASLSCHRTAPERSENVTSLCSIA